VVKERSLKLALEKVEIPITGRIISVNVKVGSVVEEGDILFLIESMKMENPILAPVKGTVIEINLSPEQIVQAGEIVATIEYLEK